MDMTKQNTPAEISFHCGLANSSIRMIEATSGFSSFSFLLAAISFGSFSAGVTAVAVTSVDGDGGVLLTERSGEGTVSVGGLVGSAGLDVVELKRKAERTLVHGRGVKT